MKVLLLDDIAANLNLLERVLQKEGFEVLKTASPYDALNILSKEYSIGAIVTDYMMPDLKGFDFFEAFRTLPNFKMLPMAALPPCILITAWAQEFKPEDALNMGFHAVLRKPFPNDEIVKVLKDIESGKTERAQTALFIGFEESIEDTLKRLSMKINYPFIFKDVYIDGLKHYKRDQFINSVVIYANGDTEATKDLINQILQVERINDQGHSRNTPIIVIGPGEDLVESFKEKEQVGFLLGPINYRTLAERLSEIQGTDTNKPKRKSRRSHKALIVDDLHSSLILHSFMLNQMDYDVVTANSPDEALDILSSDQGLDIDVVLSDYYMPDLNGLEFFKLCQEQRAKDPLFSDIKLPFVIYSAYCDQEIVQNALAAGVVEVLKKPLNPEELKTILEKANC